MPSMGEAGREFRHVHVDETFEMVRVTFRDAKKLAEPDVDEVGRELLATIKVAARLARPLILSMVGVKTMSSALVGKLVVLHQNAKVAGVELRLCDLPDDGPAGVLAVLKPPPKSDGGRAQTPKSDEDKS